MMIGEAQFPGRHGAVWLTVLSSVADDVEHVGSYSHGGVQVTRRHTTGP